LLSVEDRDTMAKALFGHVGLGPDIRMLAELRRLRRRVRDLEQEVARLRSATAARSSGPRVDDDDDDVLTLSVHEVLDEREPALT
jgi:hypothetical protein